MLEKKDWESQFFNKQIAQVTQLSTLGKRELEQFELVEYCTDTLSVSESQALTELGFSWWETQLDFELALSDAATENSEAVSDYNPTIHGNILNLVTGLYHESRFYQPPFTSTQGLEFYRQWLANACQQCFDDLCLVACLDRQPAGFVTLKFDQADQSSRIGLIGVTPHCQGQGLGKQLFNAAVDRSRDRGLRTLKVKTQLDNRRSIEFYVAQGARIRHIEQRFILLN